jgi:cell division protein FtsQ
VIVAVAVVVVAGLGWGVLQSPWFSAEHIAVRGEVHTPERAILRVSGLDIHPPLVTLDVGSTEAAIERLPWVSRAFVRKIWPSSVAVTIVERHAVALVHTAANAWAEVDATGRILADAQAGLPVLASVTTRAPLGSYVSSGLAPALKVAASIPPVLAGKVSSVSLVAGGQVDMSVQGPAGQVTVHIGPAADLGAKMESLATVLSGGNMTGVTVIDVTVPNLPVTS